MKRFRWRLARLIAPAPIMRDPFPGEDGVFILGVQGNMVWSIRAKRFRLKSTRALEVREYGVNSDWDYAPSHPFVRFVGTVAP